MSEEDMTVEQSIQKSTKPTWRIILIVAVLAIATAVLILVNTSSIPSEAQVHEYVEENYTVEVQDVYNIEENDDSYTVTVDVVSEEDGEELSSVLTYAPKADVLFPLDTRDFSVMKLREGSEADKAFSIDPESDED